MKKLRKNLIYLLVILTPLLFFWACDTTGGGGTGNGNSVSVTAEGTTATDFTNIAATYMNSASGPVTLVPSIVIAADLGQFPSILIEIKATAAGKYTVAADEVIVSYGDATTQQYVAQKALANTSGSATITSYGVVGEKVVGTFDVMADKYVGPNPSGIAVSVTGSFSVTRVADDSI